MLIISTDLRHQWYRGNLHHPATDRYQHARQKSYSQPHWRRIAHSTQRPQPRPLRSTARAASSSLQGQDWVLYATTRDAHSRHHKTDILQPCQTSTTVDDITTITSNVCAASSSPSLRAQGYEPNSTSPSPSCTHFIRPTFGPLYRETCTHYGTEVTATVTMDCGGCALETLAVGHGPVSANNHPTAKDVDRLNALTDRPTYRSWTAGLGRPRRRGRRL